jgi:hypothetical protein
VAPDACVGKTLRMAAGHKSSRDEDANDDVTAPPRSWPPAPPALSLQPQTAEIAAPALPPRGADPVQSGPGTTRHAESQDWGVPDDYRSPVLGRSRVAEPPEPVPLRPARWVRAVYLATVLVCGPTEVVATSMAFSDDKDVRWAATGLTAAASALLLLAVIVWTWVNVDNGRRLLADTRHRAPVSPLRAVLWWLSIPLIGLPLFGAVLFLVDRYVDSPDRNAGDVEVLRAFLLLGWFLVVLVLWARPYLYLGSVMRRIHGDSTVFIRWVWVPIVAMMLATTVVLIAGLTTRSGVDTDNPKALGAMIIALSVVPYVVWCWLGWRAMSAMDELLRARSARQRVQRDLYLQTERRTATAPQR